MFFKAISHNLHSPMFKSLETHASLPTPLWNLPRKGGVRMRSDKVTRHLQPLFTRGNLVYMEGDMVDRANGQRNLSGFAKTSFDIYVNRAMIVSEKSWFDGAESVQVDGETYYNCIAPCPQCGEVMVNHKNEFNEVVACDECKAVPVSKLVKVSLRVGEHGCVFAEDAKIVEEWEGVVVGDASWDAYRFGTRARGNFEEEMRVKHGSNCVVFGGAEIIERD